MTFLRSLTVWLVLGVLSLSAQAQNAGPSLWTSYIDSVGNYLRASHEANFVSRFTPGVAITVTRMQLQAAFGSQTQQQTKCNQVPRVRVTDGTTEYSLPIPNARQSGPFPHSVHADSGPISVSFPANAALSLNVVPGSTGCFEAGSINVNVQYGIN